MVLDEPKSVDSVQEADGIKVLFDRELEAYTKGFEIDYKNSIFGKRFVVNQLYGSRSCS